MLVPLYGFLQGDTIGLLILATDDTTIEGLAEQLIGMARLRVDRRGTPRVEHGGKVLPADVTVAEAGLAALDRVDVRWG